MRQLNKPKPSCGSHAAGPEAKTGQSPEGDSRRGSYR